MCKFAFYKEPIESIPTVRFCNRVYNLYVDTLIVLYRPSVLQILFIAECISVVLVFFIIYMNTMNVTGVRQLIFKI